MQQLIPTSQDIDMARHCGQKLAMYAQKDISVSLQMPNRELATLPSYVVDIVTHVLEAVASGKAVTIIPKSTELTTVEAASMLNVSRPFLIKELDEGKLPFRKVGKHRRIRLEDVVLYKDKIDARREKALEELTMIAQQENMGY